MKDSDGNLLKVHTDGTSGSCIFVPKTRVTEVKRAMIKIINLGNDVDVDAAQTVLDALK
jgi:hypothetical protein